MDNGNDEENVETKPAKKSRNESDSDGRSKFAKMKHGLSSLNDFRNDVKEQGGIGGLVKNVAKDKINGKINAGKEALKQKANGMVPESVRKKQEQIKAKKDNLKNKLNAPKEKIDQAKIKMNEQAFKGTVKKLFDASIAPGAGAAAEKLLESPLGEKPMEAARNASNPIAAIKEGTKKLFEIFVKREIVKKSLIYVAPIIVVIFLVLLVPLFNDIMKNEDADIYARAGAESSKLPSEYKTFYKSVSEIATTNKKMIVAVLTAYKRNDEYVCKNEIECNDTSESGIVETMKKYIKEVDDAIKSSSDGIDEGDYEYPQQTGSDFFKWLYNDFVVRYYSEHFDGLYADSSAYNEKKEKIIRTIYELYRELLKNGACQNSYYNAKCPSVTVNSATYSLEDYIAGVVKSEMGAYYNDPEVLKAFAVAARSFLIGMGKCGKVLDNSESFQTFKEVDPNNDLDKKYIEAANSTAGKVVLKKDNSILITAYVTIPVSKYITKDGDIWKFEMLHDSNDPSSKYYYSMNYQEMVEIAKPAGGIYKPAESSDHHWGMLSYGAVHEARQGKTYDQILKIFYGEDTILADTIESNSGSSGDCGSSSEGLLKNPDGYVSRIGRPKRSNPFFYSQDENGYPPDGMLEGECAWYATARAKEILSEMNSDISWTYNGHGKYFCTSANYDKDKFVVSTDYTKPQAGALVGWSQGDYGHVAVVEKVEGNTVTISEAGLSFGPTELYGCSSGSCVRPYVTGSKESRKKYCESDASGCFRTTQLSIEAIRTYVGSFQCYIYLAQPKKST